MSESLATSYLQKSTDAVTGKLLVADPEASMRVALAFELLHAASLLHDDLIDDARTRRGHDAAFRRYGNVVSVMSGDYLLAWVLGLLATSRSSEFTMLMSQTAARICEGEVLQFQMATLETEDMAALLTDAVITYLNRNGIRFHLQLSAIRDLATASHPVAMRALIQSETHRDSTHTRNNPLGHRSSLIAPSTLRRSCQVLR